MRFPKILTWLKEKDDWTGPVWTQLTPAKTFDIPKTLTWLKEIDYLTQPVWTQCNPLKIFVIPKYTLLAERNLRLDKTNSSQILEFPNLLIYPERIKV